MIVKVQAPAKFSSDFAEVITHAITRHLVERGDAEAGFVEVIMGEFAHGQNGLSQLVRMEAKVVIQFPVSV